MNVSQLIAGPLTWVVVWAMGLSAILWVYGHGRLRRWAYEKAPKPLVMAVMMGSQILPPVVLPFTGGPAIGLPPVVVIVFGGLLVGASVAVKIASQRRIGNLPALRAKSNLVTEGAYRIVRHPLYLSNALMALGLALLMNSLHALVFFFPYGAGYALIVYFEEAELIRQYGKAYTTYRNKVPWRLVPKLY